MDREKKEEKKKERKLTYENWGTERKNREEINDIEMDGEKKEEKKKAEN